MSALDAVPASPTLSVPEAEAIALGLFGLRALPGRTKSLGSCQDANFRICTADQRKYVLKISNIAFGEPVLDLQNQAMLHLGVRMAHRKTLQIPAPLRRVCAVFPESARCVLSNFTASVALPYISSLTVSACCCVGFAASLTFLATTLQV